MKMSKIALTLRLFVVMAVCFSFAYAAEAQCQNQVCALQDGCYRCNDTNGQGCEVVGCTRCTNTLCGGLVARQGSPLLPNGQLASLPESGRCSSATSLTLAKLASTAKDDTIFGLFTPEVGGTPLLISASFGNPVLFLQGVLLNRGPKTIVAYRIGWVYGYQDRAPVVDTSNWQNVHDGIKSNETRTIPKLSAPSVSSINGAQLIQFFVAEVKFSDGTTWQQDQAKIREVGATVRSGKSASQSTGSSTSAGS